MSWEAAGMLIFRDPDRETTEADRMDRMFNASTLIVDIVDMETVASFHTELVEGKRPVLLQR